MKKQFDQVSGFHKGCGIEMPEVPTVLARGPECPFYSVRVESVSEELKNDAKNYGDEDPVRDRASYMLEEIAEFLDARTIEDQADALIDLIYFAIGTFTLMGINPEPLFDIVARANLGKIMPDGTVLRDEQGKIVKPPGWAEQYAPEKLLKLEIERQAFVSGMSEAPPMSIYTPIGEKVVFLNRNGLRKQPEGAVKIGLEEGGVYTVESIEVGGWSSYVTLAEFPSEHSFNTVMFANYKKLN